MSIQFDTFLAEIAAETNAETAALILVNGILEQAAAAGTDLNKLAEFRRDLTANKEACAEAVVANTARFTSTPPEPPPASRAGKDK